MQASRRQPSVCSLWRNPHDASSLVPVVYCASRKRFYTLDELQRRMAARNYIQDIVPEEEPAAGGPEAEPHMAPERSIRNIQSARIRPIRGGASNGASMSRTAPARPPNMNDYEPSRQKRGRWGMWIAALVACIVLIGAGALVFFPSTTISVSPHTQVVPLDAATPFIAYPAASAASGSISYTVVSQSYDDSAVVAASGVEEAQEKATGTITVYNEYSDSPVRLIKNTRFQSPDGHVFRIPASVDVPGRKGGTPGTIQVTVFADQTGESYNIAPVDRFTLPGLKSTADMYAKVYAKSTTKFEGGFSGERPAVPPATLEAARSEMRARLNEKTKELAQTVPQGLLAFPGLANVTFETLPPTSEPGGGVRIHERATIVLPVFTEALFAQAIAQAVSASAEGQSISLRFAGNVSAQASSTLAQQEMGEKPLGFSLSGSGQLVWNVDAQALAEALSGREESAFETIIQGFPAVEEARARITPFWKHAFPLDPSKIKVTIEEPARPF